MARGYGYAGSGDRNQSGDTDLQLLHPVLTFGLLVLARRCLEETPCAKFRDDTEDMTVGVGEDMWRRCWVATSGDMVAQSREGACDKQLP